MVDVNTRWIDDDEAFAAVAEEIAAEPVYAIDTEFHRERTYWPHLALVQIAWPGGLVLVDPLAVDLAPLARVFAAGNLAVVHAADQDLEVLDVACRATPQRLFDTQLAAGFLGYSSPSLASLVERLLTTKLTKGDRLTDWTQRPLTDAQKRYAADDVAYLLAVHAELVRRLDKVGRRAWAEEECAEMLANPRPPQDPERAWWRIKESRSLRGAARGVCQAVAAWRERRAMSLDRPPRTVLSDLAVLGIAHRQPKTLGDLKSIRGLDSRQLRDDVAQELLGIVEEGRTRRPQLGELPPTDDLDRRLRPAATLASAWVAQLAQDLKIDAALLATRADLHDFLREAPSGRLAHGWRAELVGERVKLLVDGHAAMAFRPGRGDLVLEERSGRELAPDIPVPDDDADAPASGAAAG
ncbi:MAG TPA: HRDC domain-containing protein [Acidimicrobiales bacterium]